MSALSEHRFRITLLSAFITLSWTILWLWGRTPYGQHFHHAGAGAFPVFSFALGWTLMTVAMMLPTSFPLVGLFHMMVSDRRHRTWLVGLCIAGYLFIWVTFGVIVHFGVSNVYPFLTGANFRTALLAVA